MKRGSCRDPESTISLGKKLRNNRKKTKTVIFSMKILKNQTFLTLFSLGDSAIEVRGVEKGLGGSGEACGVIGCRKIVKKWHNNRQN